jgi:hypothetical protein
MSTVEIVQIVGVEKSVEDVRQLLYPFKFLYVETQFMDDQQFINFVTSYQDPVQYLDNDLVFVRALQPVENDIPGYFVIGKYFGNTVRLQLKQISKATTMCKQHFPNDEIFLHTFASEDVFVNELDTTIDCEQEEHIRHSHNLQFIQDHPTNLHLVQSDVVLGLKRNDDVVINLCHQQNLYLSTYNHESIPWFAIWCVFQFHELQPCFYEYICQQTVNQLHQALQFLAHHDLAFPFFHIMRFLTMYFPTFHHVIMVEYAKQCASIECWLACRCFYNPTSCNPTSCNSHSIDELHLSDFAQTLISQPSVFCDCQLKSKHSILHDHFMFKQTPYFMDPVELETLYIQYKLSNLNVCHTLQQIFQAQKPDQTVLHKHTLDYLLSMF